MASKKLPDQLTSYDLIKAAAVLLMIIDHIGFYFLPDEEWFRAIGRLCVPIWMFLIGYANTRDISRMLIGGGILTVVGVIVGMPIFPLNILFVMACMRLMIDYIMLYAQKGKTNIWEIALAMFLLYMPVNFISQYSTSAMVLAMFGYATRHREKFGDKTVFAFMLFTACLYAFYQQMIFNFSLMPMLVMVLGTVGICARLQNFSGKIYPGLTTKTPQSAVKIIQFCGRYTLEIYIVHLIIFRIAALLLGMEDFAFLQFKLFEF